MATPEVTSSVTSPAPGWAKRFPLDERLFLWAVLASVVAMTVFVVVWLYVGHQNVPATSFATTPEAFAAKASALADRYQAPDGRVYLPPGKDGYLLASRYSWYPELALQTGKRYRIWLSSADALHGFSLVGQNLNLEVAPRHAMGVWLTAGKPGRHLIVCNEFCGLGHAHMTGYLDVVSADAMQAHARAARAAAAPAKPAAGVTAGKLQLGVKGTDLVFDKKTLTAHAGKVTLVLANKSVMPHNVAIKGNGVDAKGPVVGPGKTSTVTAELKPGTYTFYCTVPGHAQAGMRGTLTVKP